MNPRGHLERCYRFPDFVRAMDFANRIAPLAEAAGHHPELHIGWGECTVETWSHDVDGLSERDFTLAGEVDKILETST